MCSIDLDNRIKDLETEIEQISSVLAAKKAELSSLRQSKAISNACATETLTNEEISRFSRQLILPEIGVKGQIKLRSANVLIVGAGGLGKIFCILSIFCKRCLFLESFMFRLSICFVFMWSGSWPYWNCRL